MGISVFMQKKANKKTAPQMLLLIVENSLEKQKETHLYNLMIALGLT